MLALRFQHEHFNHASACLRCESVRYIWDCPTFHFFGTRVSCGDYFQSTLPQAYTTHPTHISDCTQMSVRVCLCVCVHDWRANSSNKFQAFSREKVPRCNVDRAAHSKWIANMHISFYHISCMAICAHVCMRVCSDSPKTRTHSRSWELPTETFEHMRLYYISLDVSVYSHVWMQPFLGYVLFCFERALRYKHERNRTMEEVLNRWRRPNTTKPL